MGSSPVGGRPDPEEEVRKTGTLVDAGRRRPCGVIGPGMAPREGTLELSLER